MKYQKNHLLKSGFLLIVGKSWHQFSLGEGYNGVMKQVVRQELEEMFDLSTEIANTLEEKQYGVQLGSSSPLLGQIILDLVCRRERLLYLLKHHTTRQWSCSVEDPRNKLQMMQALFHSSADFLVWLDHHDLTETETHTLLQLIASESYTHGKLHSFFQEYSLSWPASWIEHYREKMSHLSGSN